MWCCILWPAFGRTLKFGPNLFYSHFLHVCARFCWKNYEKLSKTKFLGAYSQKLPKRPNFVFYNVFVLSSLFSPHLLAFLHCLEFLPKHVKNVKKSYFNHCLEWAVPKFQPKYTTQIKWPNLISIVIFPRSNCTTKEIKLNV